MSNEVWAAIMGSAIIVIASAVGWIGKTVVDQGREIASIKMFIELWGRNVSLAMHSPHTLEFDALVDKYSKNHELSWGEWQELKAETEKAMKNPLTPKAEIAAYAGIKALCEHKLTMPNYNKPPRRD